MCTASLLAYFPSSKAHGAVDLGVVSNTSELLKKQSSKKSFMPRHGLLKPQNYAFLESVLLHITYAN